MKYERFKNFICEQTDKNPKYKSGSLEADITRNNTSGPLSVDPNRNVILQRIARAMVADKSKISDQLKGKSHHATIKSLIAAGVKPSVIIDANADANRQLNANPDLGGRLRDFAKKFQTEQMGSMFQGMAQGAYRNGFSQAGRDRMSLIGDKLAQTGKGYVRSVKGVASGVSNISQGNVLQGMGDLAGAGADYIGTNLRLTPQGMALDAGMDAIEARRQNMRDKRDQHISKERRETQQFFDQRRADTDKRMEAIRNGTDPELLAKIAEREQSGKNTPYDPMTSIAGMNQQRRGIGQDPKTQSPVATPTPPPSTGGGPFAQIRQRIQKISHDARQQIKTSNLTKELAQRRAETNASLDANMIRARNPLPSDNPIRTDPSHIGSMTGVYVKGTPADKRRLADEAGLGNLSREALQTIPRDLLARQAAEKRINKRVLAPQANNVLGGDPRDKDGNVVANTIPNRDREINSRILKPGETKIGSNRVGFEGTRVTSNERDLNGRMYRDSKKEYSRIRREDERRDQEKADNSVDGQMKKISSMTPAERAAYANKLNNDTYNPSNNPTSENRYGRNRTVPDSFRAGHKPETDTERKYAGMRNDMGLAPRTPNNRMR